MSDQSNAEGQYFMDSQKYNCPYCNIRSVGYTVLNRGGFNWDDERTVYIYFIKCDNSKCGNVSIHFSDYYWSVDSVSIPFGSMPTNFGELKGIEGYDNKTIAYAKTELDSLFFYHKPTSFFTIDDRIPKSIRELVSEAEGCKEIGFMVGASGALRKSIYKFLKHEKAVGKKYDTKIKWLKTKYKNIDSDYFDILGKIKDMNDQDMHEGDWKSFSGGEFKELIGAMKAVLYEIYVEPLLKKGLKERIFGLKKDRVEETSEQPVG